MAEFKKGDLVVNLTNEATAYPTLPDTGTQVTGTTRYAWFKREGGSRVSLGASTKTLAGRTLDGSTYECDVSYEADSGSIPQGVKIGNNPAKATFSIVADAGQVTECPDGSYVPVGQECDKPQGECGTPTYESGGMTPTGQLAAANGTQKSISFTVTYRGFSQFNGVTFKSGTSQIWGAITPAETFGPQSYTTDIGGGTVNGSISGDVCTITGSFSAPFDGINTDIVKAYFANINLVFECNGQPILLSSKIGGTSIKWGDQKGEVTEPVCRYGGYFSNQEGCGSYISQVTDPADGTVKYYAVGKEGSTDPADFQGEWTVDNPIFNCQICPAKDCPSAVITRVYVSPASPKVGEQVTAFV